MEKQYIEFETVPGKATIWDTKPDHVQTWPVMFMEDENGPIMRVTGRRS